MSSRSSASLAAFDRQDAEGAVKIWEDLERYAKVIADTRPEVLIECGTWEGRSAMWFADQGPNIVTIDHDPAKICSAARARERITFLTGSTVGADTIEAARAACAGRRTMVVLDSDHSPAHVEREIDAYGSMVTVGCYLVVEDGMIRSMPSPFSGDQFPGPLDAIESRLIGDPHWEPDRDIEAMHPATMHPMGWWKRLA